MDLADIKIKGLYRYEGLCVRAVATLPGGPSEDDPEGPQNGDMVMIHYAGDDHKFIVDPADLEPEDGSDMYPHKCPECGVDLKSDGYPIRHKTDEGDDCSFKL